jgi:biopolymer transport protein ExbB/TolQ
MFWISNGLLVPVIIGLLFFFFKVLLQAGSFFSHYLHRARREKQVEAAMKEAASASALVSSLRDLPPTPCTAMLLDLYASRDNPARMARAISGYELRADSELGKTRLPARFGPILGLMGTLIPMGPALVGLSTGEITSMAYNMQIVFATTVLGLLTGAIAYVIIQVRQRWISSDLVNMDYLVDLLQQEQERS